MARGFKWRGREAKEAYKKATNKALGQAAELLLTEANRGVPIEEGTLERSGSTSLDEEASVAVVAYDTPYAVDQHEKTWLRHDEGRRAKWLQLALQENSKALIDFIGDEIRKEVP